MMGDVSPEAFQGSATVSECGDDGRETMAKRDWKKQIRLLMYSFLVSGFYVSLPNLLIKNVR